jgi:uncharacterized membrane protein YkvA (DUF1232 family)
MALSFNPNTLKRVLRTGIKNIKNADVARLLRNSKAIRRLTSGPLAEVAEDVGTLFTMVRDVAKGDYREVPRTTLLSATFALLYILNPFDLMPDFVPGIGYLDDISLTMVVLRAISNDLDEYRSWTRKKQTITKRIKNTVAGIKRRISLLAHSPLKTI